MNLSRTRLAAWSTVGLLVLGVGTVTTGAVLYAAGDTSNASATPTPGVSAPAEATAPSAESALDKDRPIAELADPEWLTRTAESTGIPERALAAYAGASLRLGHEQPSCGIGWNTIAAIGQVESHHGTIDGAVITADGQADPVIIGIPLDGGDGVREVADTDGGELDDDTTWDRAVGPMQFLPATWDEYAADGNGDGQSDPQQIDDAALAAGRYLCKVGGDLTQPEAWIAAISAYNEGTDYNRQVAELAQSWVAGPTT